MYILTSITMNRAEKKISVLHSTLERMLSMSSLPAIINSNIAPSIAVPPIVKLKYVDEFIKNVTMTNAKIKVDFKRRIGFFILNWNKSTREKLLLFLNI